MQTVTIGLLRLTDAAPVIIAKELGFFAERNLDIRLSVEPSWANIADKLTYRKLDAAVMLPPLAFAVSLGLRGVGAPLVVPMSLSLNGNAITVSNDLAALLSSDARLSVEPLEIGRRLKIALSEKSAPLRFAVVHAFSTHNLLLRYWLAAVGIDPDRDVEITVIPPADMVQALRDRRIDGFCAGAPWGEMAIRDGSGRTIALSSEIWRNHPEKCLAVTGEWAERYPADLQALLRALLRAAQYCDPPSNARAIAAILARGDYLAVEADAILASLPGSDSSASAGNVDTSVFFANAANFPWRSHASWFLAQMGRWGYLPPDADLAGAAGAVYRPDLYRQAAASEGLPAPRQDAKAEGAHAEPWLTPADPADIAMQADQFCDRRVFEV